ncbi:TPA: class I SAM-dependent methyltransferase [Candidatus Bathyarchaeota archaeon]|nr:class I SAM-dependent methyltransferase [Candidatus Bathyarchaeota archaeon]
MFISPYVASPIPVIKRMLTLAELKPNEILYDLGCGDGRTLIIAAQDFGAKAVGIELREDLAKQAAKKVKEMGLEGRVKVIHGDLFKVNIAPADVVFLYLTTSANEKVRPKLEAELKEGARVVSHDYEIMRWKALKVERFYENPKLGYPSHTIYLYKR